MDIATFRSFFLWCTILNGGLLVFSASICAFAPDFIYRLHSRWFSVSRPAFDVAIYAFLGLYKTLFIVFNLVPYVALLIAG